MVVRTSLESASSSNAQKTVLHQGDIPAMARGDWPGRRHCFILNCCVTSQTVQLLEDASIRSNMNESAEGVIIFFFSPSLTEHDGCDGKITLHECVP